MSNLVSIEVIASKILFIRGKRVMLDSDLAVLYNVKTGRLNEQVKRNIKRFPEDFMFQLTKEELKNLMCQFGISSWGGARKTSFLFGGSCRGMFLAAPLARPSVARCAS